MTLRSKDELPLEPLPVADNVTVPFEPDVVTGPAEPGSAQARLNAAIWRSTLPTDSEARTDPPPMKRLSFVPAPHMFNLNHACWMVMEALRSMSCQHHCLYLVGSSLRKRDYRDVDVRAILDDADFDRLFPKAADGGPLMLHPMWSLFCSSVSCWLSQQTGLPVDFQVQRQTQANAEYSRKEGHGREPLGWFRRPTEEPTR